MHAPCEAPAYYENLNSHIQDKNRRLFGGMVTAIDDAMQVGQPDRDARHFQA